MEQTICISEFIIILLYYLSQGCNIFMTICLSVCLLAGLHTHYWLELHKKIQMGLGLDGLVLAAIKF